MLYIDTHFIIFRRIQPGGSHASDNDVLINGNLLACFICVLFVLLISVRMSNKYFLSLSLSHASLLLGELF